MTHYHKYTRKSDTWTTGLLKKVYRNNKVAENIDFSGLTFSLVCPCILYAPTQDKKWLLNLVIMYLSSTLGYISISTQLKGTLDNKKQS